MLIDDLVSPPLPRCCIRLILHLILQFSRSLEKCQKSRFQSPETPFPLRVMYMALVMFAARMGPWAVHREPPRGGKREGAGRRVRGRCQYRTGFVNICCQWDAGEGSCGFARRGPQSQVGCKATSRQDVLDMIVVVWPPLPGPPFERARVRARSPACGGRLPLPDFNNLHFFG